MRPTQYIDIFQKARKDKALAVIEGIQALKHAVRFGAVFQMVLSSDAQLLKQHLQDLAPDVLGMVLSLADEVAETTFQKLSPQPPRTKVIAVAKRKTYQFVDIPAAKPIVFLEEPKDLENIGAVIRVAAAADAGAVVISGDTDIWHPAVIRGAAGLQFAIPVLQGALDNLPGSRQVVSLDPGGKIAEPESIPANAVLVFGTERHGLTKETLSMSHKVVRLPMRKGVSSLNLATSVAATLYMMC